MVGPGRGARTLRAMTDGRTEFERHVDAVIAALAPGEVVSYGDVAHDAGFPGRARAVGALLSRSDGTLPWWRVVLADGRLPPPAPRQQAARLRAEGVVVRSYRVRAAPIGRFSRPAERAVRRPPAAGPRRRARSSTV